MSLHAARFESLGANCEFGFFLQAQGNDETSLFKWAEVIGIDGLTRLLRNDFAGMFAYKNVVPFNANMVLDQDYWIAWHSKFKAEAADPTKPFSRMNAKFTTPEAERQVLWEEHYGKLQHFVLKIRANLASGERIFVYKPRAQDSVTEDEIAELQAVMRSFGPNTLLAVSVAETPGQVGTVRVMRPGLLRGYVDRFAPGHQADDYSNAAWTAVCEAAVQEVDRPQVFSSRSSAQKNVLTKVLSAARSAVRRW